MLARDDLPNDVVSILRRFAKDTNSKWEINDEDVINSFTASECAKVVYRLNRRYMHGGSRVFRSNPKHLKAHVLAKHAYQCCEGDVTLGFKVRLTDSSKALATGLLDTLEHAMAVYDWPTIKVCGNIISIIRKRQSPLFRSCRRCAVQMSQNGANLYKCSLKCKTSYRTDIGRFPIQWSPTPNHFHTPLD